MQNKYIKLAMAAAFSAALVGCGGSDKTTTAASQQSILAEQGTLDLSFDLSKLGKVVASAPTKAKAIMYTDRPKPLKDGITIDPIESPCIVDFTGDVANILLAPDGVATDCVPEVVTTGTPDIAITGVVVTLTNTQTQEQSTYDLVLNAADNTAFLTLERVPEGSWGIALKVYSGKTVVYTGTTIADVIAGKTVDVIIPIGAVVPTTGNINIILDPTTAPIAADYSPLLAMEVGAANTYDVTMPQFSFSATHTFIFNPSRAQIVTVDNATGKLVGNIQLLDKPTSVVFDDIHNKLLAGFNTGKVFELNSITGALTEYLSVGFDVTDIVPLNEQYTFVASGKAWGGSNNYAIVDTQSGAITAQVSNYYSVLSNFVFDGTAKLTAIDTGSSPQDLHSISVDLSKGKFVNGFSDSPYHGDYSIGKILSTLNTSTLLTSSGAMYSNAAANVKYQGSLGYGVLAADILNTNQVAVIAVDNSNYYPTESVTGKLKLVNMDTLLTSHTALIDGYPLAVNQVGNSLMVFTFDRAITNSNKQAGLYFSKIDLPQSK